MTGGLLAELKRRNVIRAALLYIGAVWALAQGISQIGPSVGAPEWATRWFLAASAIGLPFWLGFAWFFELTPEGLKLERDVAPEASITARTARRLDFWIIGALALAVVLLLTDRLVRGGAAAPDKSVAVLPFADLSPAHDQAYFSEGMAEEILNALAAVKDLKVAGRNSAFALKDRNADLRAIGQALAVANVLEGSVRKQDDRVRITAQLVRAADGYQLWSESYDGDLKDVFALQERIARAITGRLQVVLQGRQQQRLVPVATDDPQAYSLYLQASSIFNRREGARLPEAVAELEQALRLDPKFARAHARLAAIHALEPIYVPEATAAAVAATEREAALASALDPSLAEPYAALSVTYAMLDRMLEARAAADRALQLEPDDVNAVFWAATGDIDAGYTRRGCAGLDHVLALDPLLPNALLWRGIQYIYEGDLAQGEKLLRQAEETGLAHAGIGLSLVYAAHGQPAEAREQLARGLAPLDAGMPPQASAVVAAGVYGDAAAHAAAVALLERAASSGGRLPAAVPHGLLLLQEWDRALALLNSTETTNNFRYLHLIWSPQLRPLRARPEFLPYARRAGLVALWDRYGAPDACRRLGAGDYDCR
jgi:TolB-like protein